jgi:hypothetical protein
VNCKILHLKFTEMYATISSDNDCSIFPKPSVVPVGGAPNQHELKARIMKSFLTWLGIPISLILLVVLLFVGGRFYGQWRMAQVTQDLASLARELGYTPGSHMYHKIVKRDVNLVTGSGYCGVVLIFSTSMNQYLRQSRRA